MSQRNYRLLRAYDNLLNFSARYLFPNYFDKVKPIKNDIRELLARQIQGSTPLQIILYYNCFLLAPYIISMVIGNIWKTSWFNRRFWNFAQDWVFLIAFIVIEPVRLHLGYRGNLKERVPDLSAMCLVSIFQLIFTFSFLALQVVFGNGFTTPFEFGINLVYVVMIIMEMILGYLAAKNIALSQTTQFFMTYEKHTHDIIQTEQLLAEEGGPAVGPIA